MYRYAKKKYVLTIVYSNFTLQIDEACVLHAEDSQLRRLGVTTNGDIIILKLQETDRKISVTSKKGCWTPLRLVATHDWRQLLPSQGLSA